jgi:transcriptional regulator with XRE-family HTH domain
MAEPAPGNVTVRRMLVGARLRRLREARGVTRERAGYVIRASESKMSRLELGRVSFKERDIVDLLDFYGVRDQADRESLIHLAQEANSGGRWREYEDLLPGWFQNYVALEEVAVKIRTYETHFIPGLLQTPGYARAVIRHAVPPLNAMNLERAVTLRQERQRALTRESPPQVWAVIDEAALRRPLCTPEVFVEQLRHLVTLAGRAHVALQILPLRPGVPAPPGGPFTILRFSEPDLADVVYVEQLGSSLYLDRSEQVEQYTELMNRLSVASLTPRASHTFLEELLAGT